MSPYLKAVLGFIALVLTNVAANLTDGTAVYPTSTAEWVRWLVSIIVGTSAVYLAPNTPKSASAGQLGGKHPHPKAPPV